MLNNDFARYQKVLIFLDYDGVLCDSVLESYLLSRFAFWNISPFADINEEEYIKFKAFRPYITNSWQYYNFYSTKHEEYNSITQNFNSKFLSKREELIKNNYDFWISLEKPTKFLIDIKQYFLNYPNFFRILSTKNKEAILSRLDNLGISFPDGYIFGKKDLLNLSKGEFIQKFNLDRALLIDDSKTNIDSCNKIKNIIPILTNWGYVEDPSLGYNEVEVLNFIYKIVNGKLVSSDIRP